MESLLLGILYFVRPMMATQVDVNLFGLNFYELTTIFFTLILAATALMGALSGAARVRFSTTEWWMIGFITWATVTSIFYYDVSDFKSYIKWVLPLITFMILRRSIRSNVQYKNLVGIMILGFLLPLTLSTVLIAKGMGLGQVVYWTGLERFHGAYSTVHDLGHNMTLLFVSMTIFIVVSKSLSGKSYRKSHVLRNTLFVTMAVLASYCLYKAQVRTAYLGIFFFIVVFFYKYNKKLLVAFGILFTVTLIVFGSIYYTIFFDIVDSARGESATEEAGSGRIAIWTQNVTLYSSLPFERMILGIGVGNKRGTTENPDPDLKEPAWDSHNDWLQVFMELGPFGLIFMVGIYVSLCKSILRIPGREKYAYIAFFTAVCFMNAASNSYFNRFPLAQMFYMLVVYAELRGQATARSRIGISKLRVNSIGNPQNPSAAQK